MTEGARRGGVVLRAGGRLFFVPVDAVVKVAPIPKVATVPGVTSDLVGVGLVDGEAVPVLAIGADRTNMIVCTHAGERLGVVGHASADSGFFAPDPGGPGVVVGGEAASVLDLAALYEGIQRASFPGRLPA